MKKKLFILFVCVGMSAFVMAENITINSNYGSFTKEQGDKYVGNAGTELKSDSGYCRDIISDFSLSELTFQPDTAIFNLYITSVDIDSLFALVVYGMNHYIAKGINPVYSVAHAVPGILCDSVVTYKDACVEKFVSFDVMPLFNTLAEEDTVIGFRVEMRNLTEGKPLLKSQSYKGAAGQRPFLYLAKKEGGETTSLIKMRSSNPFVCEQYGTVNISNIIPGQRVTVYDLLGQVVADQVVNDTHYNPQLPVNYYIIRIQ